MKTFLILIIAGLLINSYYLMNRIEDIEKDLAASSQFIKISNQASVNRENELQDSLEERIARLEHDLDSIQFLLGQRK